MKAENARFDYSKELQIENKKSVVKEKRKMILVHTEEELELTNEPAICVIGATSAEIEDDCFGTKDKVYVRTVLQNKACTELENRLFGEMIAEPATRDKATDRYADFRNERSRLVFGAEGAETTGRVGRITILTFKKPI